MASAPPRIRGTDRSACATRGSATARESSSSPTRLRLCAASRTAAPHSASLPAAATSAWSTATVPTATVKSGIPTAVSPSTMTATTSASAAGPALADELDSKLAEAAHLPAQRLVLAEDLGGVAEAQRAGFRPHARRDKPSDRHGHVGTKRKQPAIGVHQPKRNAIQVARGGLKRHEVLDDGRLDQLVAPRRAVRANCRDTLSRSAASAGSTSRNPLAVTGRMALGTCPLGVALQHSRVATSGTLSQ